MKQPNDSPVLFDLHGAFVVVDDSAMLGIVSGGDLPSPTVNTGCPSLEYCGQQQLCVNLLCDNPGPNQMC